jgi:riboflavin synthase
MFTGIILKSIAIEQIEKTEDSLIFSIKSFPEIKNVKIGDSIAIDGACHTVYKVENDLIYFFSSKETILKTIISEYKASTMINIELPMTINGRLDGHIVTGHIDATGILQSMKRDQNGCEVFIKIPDEFRNNIVYKGSIAINGTSLTINSVSNNIIGIYLIPITLEITNLKNLLIGSKVNLEFDMFGKYVVNLIKNYESNRASN